MAEKQTNKERLKDITDSIEQGIQDLFQSDKYATYLRTMSRFHKYSVTLCTQTSKPVELQDRAKYHLLKKNNKFFLRRFFRKVIPSCDTKTVPNGLRTQRIQRKTEQNEKNLTKISLN